MGVDDADGLDSSLHLFDNIITMIETCELT